MAQYTEKKNRMPIAVALAVLLLALGGAGIFYYMKTTKSAEQDEDMTTVAQSAHRADGSEAAGTSGANTDASEDEEVEEDEPDEDDFIDQTIDDVPHAYTAYLEAVTELEQQYGKAAVLEPEADVAGDLTGLCLLQLIDFDRDGLSELLVGYREPSEGDYHFRVYGFSQGQLRLYLDSIMGGTGYPMVYAIATERLNDGQEYLITRDDILRYRIYGFDAQGNFVKRMEIGDHRLNGEPVQDGMIARAVRAWVSEEQQSYPMTMLTDAASALQGVEQTRQALEAGAAMLESEEEAGNSSEAGDDGIVAQSEHPTSTGAIIDAARSTVPAGEEAVSPTNTRDDTVKELMTQIYDVTEDRIVDYRYDDFDGDGVRDLVALSLHCTVTENTDLNHLASSYTAPDGIVDDTMRLGNGRDYTMNWWFNNGEELYCFDSMTAPIVTGEKLMTIETDAGLQLAATIYWKDAMDAQTSSTGMGGYDGVSAPSDNAVPSGSASSATEILTGAQAAAEAANHGGLNATMKTESTGVIYRFDGSGVTTLWNEIGYRFSNPGRNRIGYSCIHYTRGVDGSTNESCTYGSLRYSAEEDAYRESLF